MLTTRTLRQKWPGSDRWLPDSGQRGGGRLVARITADSVLLYFQYFQPQPGKQSKRRWLPFGVYDETGERGVSLQRARDRAAELSALYRSGVTDLHGHFEHQRAVEARKRREEAEAARVAELESQRGTLRQLLDAYVGHLERNGKQSARDVRLIFQHHVFEAAPDLAVRKAADLSVDHLVGLIGRLVEGEKGRTADKLRSYLRAAYQLAVDSKTDPSVPMALRSFGITVNPVASIGALAQFNRARDRVLSAPELGAFLRHVDAMPESTQKDALHLLLYLGGQRPAQLVRLKATDVDLAAAKVTLYDAKGKRAQPRQHVLPLVKEAAAIVKHRLSGAEPGAPVLSIDGKTNLHPETISLIVSEIATKMVKAEDAREAFQLRDLRRTCETMLAGLGVSSDVRAQLQSHGLGGVQHRHYNKHSYSSEKKQALELWARHLDRLRTGKSGKVVSMRKPRVRLHA